MQYLILSGCWGYASIGWKNTAVPHYCFLTTALVITYDYKINLQGMYNYKN